MTAPIIGLTTYREDAAWGVWRQRADVLPTAYAAAVEATGGVPVLLPPVGQVGALVPHTPPRLLAVGAEPDQRSAHGARFTVLNSQGCDVGA